VDFGHAAILAGGLDGGCGVDVLAKGLHGNAGRRRDMLDAARARGVADFFPDA
jgi:hypothetical protein